jgi:cytochrome c-type biogenesis protein CcmH/NrfG
MALPRSDLVRRIGIVFHRLLQMLNSVKRVPVMVFSSRVSLLTAMLLCAVSALLQAQKADVEPITSALRAHDLDRAIGLARTALKQSPSNPQIWSMQGIALASKGDSKIALESFQQALKISPDYVAALAGAAQLQYQAGDLKAIPLLNHLLQLRPGDPTSHAMLAVLEYRQGHCAAATHFEKSGGSLTLSWTRFTPGPPA